MVLTLFVLLIGCVTFLVSMYMLIGAVNLIGRIVNRHAKDNEGNFPIAKEAASYQRSGAEGAVHGRP